MKTIAIALLTSFYLLITTGMFVCVVHCSAEALTAKPSMKMQGHSCCAKMAHEKEGKDSGCCKKHGAFLLKENLKPGNAVQFTQTVSFIPPAPSLIFTATRPGPAYSSSLIANNSPPGRTGKHLVIKFCSILILLRLAAFFCG